MASSQQQQQLINSVDRCRSIVGSLLKEKEIAIDLEGVDLGRQGRISIVQIATRDGKVFLFDITTMGASAFDSSAEGGGRLRELLQSTSVQKVVFDGRADNDALHHLFDSGLKNVFDLQVQFTYRYGDKNDEYLKGLEYCIKKSNFLPTSIVRKLERIKRKGKRFYSPNHGGNFDVWEKRPLHPDLVKYAAMDVQYMLPMKDANNAKGFTTKWNKRIENISQKRIDDAASRKAPALGAKRDFEIPDLPHTKYNDDEFLSKKETSCNYNPIPPLFCGTTPMMHKFSKFLFAVILWVIVAFVVGGNQKI